MKYWNTPAELPGHVALALMETREHYPAEGWVRASQAMTPETKTEIAELRARVAELTQEAESKGNRNFESPADLAQGDDVYDLVIKVTGYQAEDILRDGTLAPGASRYVWTVPIPVTWNEILQAMGPTLLHEASEPELQKSLLAFARQQWADRRKELKPKDLGGTRGEADTTPSAVEDVVVQFLALGVISRGVKKRTVSDRGKYWALTDLGEDQMMKLRAIRRA